MDNGGLRGLKVLSTVLCICHTLLFSCPFVLSLSFRTQPVSVVQKQGGAVLLRCVARPASASLTWLFQGQPLQTGALPGVEVHPGSLSLSSLQPQHTGLYQCVAHLDTNAIASRQARVAIANIEEFGATHRRALTVKEGDTAVIQCPLPPSNPPALPRYRIRGKWLEESTGPYLILPSGNLQIVSVSPEHQGMYKCGAYNPVTRETRVEAHGTKLIVKDSDGSSPVGIVYPVSPVSLTVEQSMSLVLECVVSGSPSPVAKWTKDGHELLASRLRLQNSNLVLSDVQLSDGGNYTCSVQTEDGDVVSATYNVNVLVAASIMRALSDQTVSSGSSVQFICAVWGNPAPKITWLFNSSPILTSSHVQISNFSLHISSVTAQDKGMYQCLLDNGIGSAQSAARLSVQSGETSLPVILSPPESGVYAEGEPVTLSCNASGQPLPVIRWYNSAGPIATHPALLLQAPGGEAMPPEDVLSHLTMSHPGSSSLYIQTVTTVHAGKYICVASNELGSVQAEAFLTVEPQSSSMVIPVETQPTVHPIQNDEGEEMFLPLGGGDAVGPPTEQSSDKLTPEAPIIISPPQTHKPNTYDLEWRAGRDWGSPVNAYFVRYRKVEDMGNVVGSWHTVRVPGSEKSLPLSDLEPSSLYEVLMVARSAAGEGQPAMLTFRTGKERSSSSSKNPSKAPFVSQPEKAPEDKAVNTHYGVVIHDRVPEAPDRPTISVATESSVYVAWIPRANGGSPITAFRVEYRKQGRSGDWIIADDNISPLKLSVEVRNLEPGSTYRFRVIAMNNYGESPHSAISRPYQVAMVSPPMSNRPVAPVSGPHISSIDAVSDTQIMVRWTYTPSSNNNTPIQGFYIYYRPTDSDNDSDYKRDMVEGIKRWHMIGQLQPETSYDIKMQCFNDAGESEYSNVMICETKARQPPGVPSQRPITPPGVYPPDPPSSAGGLLYLIVGCVLGVMVLILLVFIIMCLWRNRQQHNMHKYDPPGYLYQPAEMNGHVLEYTTLPGSSRVNGSIHAGYGHGGPVMPQGCHHLHHKLPNGLTLLNGSGPLYPSGHSHSHDTPLQHSTMDYEHPHPHTHIHNGGGMYTALPQTDSSDCMNCQNFCNNNRCYTKANGNFSGGTLPLMHRVAQCQLDGLEMVPLNHSSLRCSGNDSPQFHGNSEQEAAVETEDTALTPTHNPCRVPVDAESGAEQRREPEEPLQCVDSDGPVVCWERLGLPDLDCKDKTAWISSASLTGDLIQPTVQEI
ncbi:cell adhesion molecule-related/down-regulated by oncogenes [Pygocentrus nattereri]|uniref:Cell adhesion molecule-related/down-regulated by oncogenes n=1 Tax=Pygocentrus nattereri TaxID=42514 RepID=A0AAR2JVD2_PYGNA|nr:cell adhesion molecule-related/down-regulated by oncogenes [Pygocentrus nattereri]XP_017578057.1 cell adhesion molecule-related/down-regulated by oncogenes [Pygocentrus nattereri]XP_017578058.1 cell adhesion molecule-related/down-regulated by oncogenes [Pygocentrus nattereri]XP_017578059.1 cell adhesion molecule-related/down-regulated by oncogenes [Pygocentrus nattereri]